MFKRIIQIIFLVSVVALAISFWQKDKLPDKDAIDEKLYQEPIQTETEATEFMVVKEGQKYEIKPLFNYELRGLVVSYHHSQSWWDYYHKEWGDYLNAKDICVIWGSNIETEVYQHMKFKSGSWTCYQEFKTGTDREIWSKFANNQGSNNHLLSNNPGIDQKIMEARTGDQIHLKGYLAEYALEDESFQRGSSVSRDDQGNGACETVYVTDFEILKKGNDLWWLTYYYVHFIIVGCLVLLFILFFRNPFKKKRSDQ